MKKSIKLLINLAVATLLTLNITGCNNKPNDKTIVVGASPIPHKEILQAAKPLLEKQGYTLEITEFQDYSMPNTALKEKSLDANFFQHVPFLEKQKAERNYDFEYTAKIHIEPLGIYSRKVSTLEEISDGSEITIPNDETNRGRALKLLENTKLIKLKEGVKNPTIKDIEENRKNLVITEIEAAQLPRTLEEVSAAIINTNYALIAKLNPVENALALEEKDSPYANVLVCRREDMSSEKIKALTKALTSNEVKKFIEDKYKGIIVPTF
ncbi:D-methionine transport system substrate-binding protein [Hathewaya proteolytica DSM 3090]|uniref:Lipoprotein n=1 Tax=Hathewaya proteolytica DSM 3090 TaxID=1121331 RepID=A0A1M6QNU6_9CLOT|nr:MetQ/NlpA family ABC transporter substrate-binding protein [Hathewaya proteolytica]SHK21763.1 D-methionine transport system substrate-binding protein [Hathewaya proteolytica DSM 3090]